MPQDIFISHSAQDKPVADTLCASLEKAGIRCWIAPRDVHPGRSFAGEITRAIQQSKVMVLVFSKHSNDSKQVLREVQLAVEADLHIIQFRIEDVRLNDDLRYFLSTPHWFNALTRPLEDHLPRLRNSIAELLSVSPAQERPPVAAAEQPSEANSKLRSETVEQTAPTSSTRMVVVVSLALLVVAVIATFFFLGQRRVAQKPENILASPSPFAIIATPTPTPELVAVVPTPSPTPEPLKSSPPTMAVALEQHSRPGIPRNNRPWRTWISEFVRLFVRTNDMEDVDLSASFYAPNVEVFDEGSKPAEAIRRDIVAYNDRWPTRRTNIRGDIQLKEVIPDREYTASFQQEFYVESSVRQEWIKGVVAVDLKIEIVDLTPRISSIKDKTLKREKGKL